MKGPSEAEFQAQVIELARHLNWRAAHFRKVRVQRANGSVYWETPVAADGKGFPDLLLLQGARLLVPELKTDTGRLIPEQKLWLEAFEEVGAETTVWRPKDWRLIEKTLGL